MSAQKENPAPVAAQSGASAPKYRATEFTPCGPGVAAWDALYADPVASFLDCMVEAGIAPHNPADIVGDGLLHRFRVFGDKPGSANGWAALHLDGIPSGAFGSWRAGVSSTWCARTRADLSPGERADLARRMEQARAQRDAEQRQRHVGAAIRASELWAKSLPADPGHSYLVKKRVLPHGARQLGGRLVLPVTTMYSEMVSLQFIDADGVKRLLAGGRKRGCVIVVADPPCPWRTLICEGWATGASLAEADPAARVLAAVDAGNLEPVALATRERWPDAAIVLAGDNDAVGQRCAHAAALAAGALVLIPDAAGQDWNDVAIAFGDTA